MGWGHCQWDGVTVSEVGVTVSGGGVTVSGGGGHGQHCEGSWLCVRLNAPSACWTGV